MLDTVNKCENSLYWDKDVKDEPLKPLNLKLGSQYSDYDNKRISHCQIIRMQEDRK